MTRPQEKLLLRPCLSQPDPNLC